MTVTAKIDVGAVGMSLEYARSANSFNVTLKENNGAARPGRRRVFVCLTALSRRRPPRAVACIPAERVP